MAADISKIDVVVEFLQRHPNAHCDRDLFDRRIFIFQRLNGFVAK